MSSQTFRKKIRVVFKNMDLKLIQASQDNYLIHTSKHLNSPDFCKVCGGGHSYDIQTRRIEPLVGHHVKYFPPVIAFVHYCCHKKIHDMKNPITKLIEYAEGDSKMYYNFKNKSLNSK